MAIFLGALPEIGVFPVAEMPHRLSLHSRGLCGKFRYPAFSLHDFEKADQENAAVYPEANLSENATFVLMALCPRKRGKVCRIHIDNV